MRQSTPPTLEFCRERNAFGGKHLTQTLQANKLCKFMLQPTHRLIPDHERTGVLSLTEDPNRKAIRPRS